MLNHNAMAGASASSWYLRLLLVALVLLLFAFAPRQGEFFWSDAPRHALNGVFVMDFLKAMPWEDPVAFAERYYTQYPALTILFYPPLFYAVSAPFYLLLGVSHSTAILVVMLHYVAFVFGAWRLFGFWMSSWRAALAAAMLAAAPEIAFWGRQVMLEVPAFAFLIWSAVALTAYRRTLQRGQLYLSLLLLVLGIYTKISVAFMVVPFAVALYLERDRLPWKSVHPWLTGGILLAALVPLVFLTSKFGQANVQSVVGIADSEANRASLQGWIWYLRRLPDQIGWPVCVAGIAGLILLAGARRRVPRSHIRMSAADLGFWFGWAISGYLFFSAIDLKEARHSIFILPPLVMLACYAVSCLMDQSRAWLAQLGKVLLALLPLLVLVQTLVWRPVSQVGGYAEAVDFIARNAPPRSRVLFSGYRDGSFIFNMRAREDRRDIGVIRADKLLLRVAVRRELGVTEKPVDDDTLSSTIDRLGVRYVVIQPGFWSDLQAMQRFERLLNSPRFERVATIPTPANHRAHEQELVIYRNLGAVSEDSVDFQIDLPIIGRSIDGKRRSTATPK